MMKARAEAAGLKRTKARAMPKSRATSKHPGFAPAVILVEPQLGENIGFAARAMANFGLTELRLFAPRDGWPSDRARAAAAGADAIIDNATVYPNLDQAVADLNFLLATTARPRGMVKPVLTLEGAARELAVRGGKGERIGIMFGPERSGLDNDAISLADAIVRMASCANAGADAWSRHDIRRTGGGRARPCRYAPCYPRRAVRAFRAPRSRA
jgi:tRNA(Leu) C34 or U34 (ribose-2'-O)-methylase TrmL